MRRRLIRDGSRFSQIVLALLAACWLAGAAGAQTPKDDSFKAGGQKIRVERYDPEARDQRHPAIVIVHGVDGLEEVGKIYRGQAEAFAKKGYVVVILHYYDRTPLSKQERAALQERLLHYFNPRAELKAEERKTLNGHFSDWTDTVRQAVAYCGRLPNVDRQRIGLAGFSLGGALALTVAAPADPKDACVAAVVELFGAFPKEQRKKLINLPPTLMIHGDMDDYIPPREAYGLERDLLAQKQPVQLKMYQRVGHMFADASLKDMLDAVSTVEVFFKKHLQNDK